MNNLIICLFCIAILLIFINNYKNVEGMTNSPLATYLTETEFMRGKYPVQGPCIAKQWDTPYAPSSCGSYADLAWHSVEPRKIVIDNQLNCASCNESNYNTPVGLGGYDNKKDAFITPDLITHYKENPHSLSHNMDNGIAPTCQSCAMIKGLADKGCGCAKKNMYIIN